MTSSNMETWRNSGRSRVQVVKTDRLGQETTELIAGGKTFSISRDDRLTNMDRAASNTLCVFSNGMLTPVRLLDGDEEAAELASNPNLISGSDMEALFKAHWKTFEKKVGEITNPVALDRMIELAEEEGTVKQLGLLRARLREVDPTRPVEGEVTQMAHISQTGVKAIADGRPAPSNDDFKPRPVTPK